MPDDTLRYYGDRIRKNVSLCRDYICVNVCIKGSYSIDQQAVGVNVGWRK